MSIAPEQPIRDSAESLFTRHGHITQLSAERLELGELDATSERLLRLHLMSCARCRACWEADHDLDASFDLTPKGAPRTADTAGAAHAGSVVAIASWRRHGIGMIAMAAASAALLFNPRPASTPAESVGAPSVLQPDLARDAMSNAAALALEVLVRDGAGSRRAEPGQAVHPGDRLGFRVTTRNGGYLMIAGVDEKGAASLYAPHPASERADALVSLAGRRTLTEEVELDAAPGRERIVAVLCPQPFSYEQLGNRLDALHPAADEPLQELFAGCVQQDIVLRKQLTPEAK